MILWKPNEKLIKERIISGERFGNYKGKDIGPFQRICNHCNETIMEFEKYDSMIGSERKNHPCKLCNKGTKGKTGAFSKTCSSSNCNNIIFYKAKGDYENGIQNNTKCKDCCNKELKKMYKGGLMIHKSEEERRKIFDKVTASRKKYYEEHPEELNILVDKRKQWRCKKYTVNNIRCQGKAEKKYIEILIKKNEKLPWKPKGVNTSIGFYFPDFEFEDRYIEIKSQYTYDILKNESKQLFKIKEVSKLKKQVEIIVIEKDEIIFTELFDKNT